MDKRAECGCIIRHHYNDISACKFHGDPKKGCVAPQKVSDYSLLAEEIRGKKTISREAFIETYIKKGEIK